MDTDPKHDDEAIQVGASVPRLPSDQNQEQDQ